jgi:hypothetical protein
MPLYKKRKPNLKIYIQIPNVIYYEDMNAKLRLKLKRN